MKSIIFLVLLMPIMLLGQMDSVSLKKYCPTKLGQEGALCFSYAPVYTALSIAHNVKNGQTNEDESSFKVFSYGFVASKVKRDKSIFGRAFNRCGRNATVDLALGVLLETGTVPFSDFQEKCDCGKVGDVIHTAQQYKIKDTSIIGDEKTATDLHIENIKTALKNNKPVVIAIVQESFFYNNKGNELVLFPPGYKQNENSANHVVCIVGFNDSVGKGSFLVKNNYTWWGVDGFSYVNYFDLIKLIRGSYTFNI